ncbi:short-chain dehydrogenase/reductase SDR [Pseudarthrobacter chlorophenolicus A6]|uniref:Short-chain dehydrogenase/reductase SDR n=1 Tax=Pseudarthrobacter chlorophenolicus (strain ATCC 700700 / DSM 12829 / CIP 107037 / JCM 12360 / KCTC 9906 / NCIMB 13794 / A6) TaxID=452863 RepID=B8H7G6_PSECP|nr:glucose 1-dehydrogenase [Pseudarthrobacter chlorophenolicus]ACL39746.1 short-chain dehydrogenase/reductase SDR [Pseudarthrobacter chlorophenolicus A6]SDQ94414.1 NAD(P)-dependent dehydrogenase, short-chain alcohol dehydrogenase family [Pseudarthrobacter chlorophenolicus]
MSRFDGRVAIITGGASGIGRATAVRFAGEGGSVVVADIQDELAAQVAAEIGAAGGHARAFHLDVTSESGWAGVVAFALEEFGRLDVLVNNAGIGDNQSIEDTSVETYTKVVAVTQTSVFLGEKAAAAALKASGNGAVVNVSSMFGIVGGFGTSPAYAAAKGAVRTLTKNTALGWATQGIRVNSVHPGFIDTPILGDTDRKLLTDTTPMARLGRPEDVAAVILFAASDDAAFMTGSELVVDGGYTAR